MVSFGFLGGGLLTFGIIIAALFIIYIFYRIILAPLLAIFGINRENVAKLSQRGMENIVDVVTKGRDEVEREEKEVIQESEAQAIAQRGEQVNQNVKQVLEDAENAQSLGPEKADVLKAMIKEQEDLLDQDAKLFAAIEKSYNEDRTTARKIRDDLNLLFRTQRGIERRALQTAQEIERYGQTDASYSSIVALCEQIRPFETQVQDLEARDVDLSRQLGELTGRRRAVLRAVRIILDDNLATLRKEPLLPQLQHLEENQTRTEQGMQQLLSLNGEAKSLVADHHALIQPLQNIEGQITPLVQQQQRFIETSLAHLKQLVGSGAIPQKMAA